MEGQVRAAVGMATEVRLLTLAKLAAGGELKRSDVRAARRLLPLQNLFYLRALHIVGVCVNRIGMKRT